MTVSSEVSKSGPYTGNGVTTSFAYGFRILDASHIRVVKTEGGVDTDLTTGFTVTGVGGASGNVVFAVAPTALQTITIVRDVPKTQTLDLVNQGAFFAEDVERSLDLAIMLLQQLSEQLDRAVKVTVGSTSNPDDLVADLLAASSAAVDAASVAVAAAAAAATFDPNNYQAKVLKLTNLLALTLAENKLPYPTGADTWALADFTALARSLLDDPNQAAMQTTLGLVPGTNVQAYNASLAQIADLARVRGMVLRGGAAAWEGITPSVAGQVLSWDGTDTVWQNRGFQPVVIGQAITNDATGLITGLGGFRDIICTVIGATATSSGRRILRVGNSGSGILSTSIYRWAQGAAQTHLRFTDSSTQARSFTVQINGFNTTEAVKPVMGTTCSSITENPIAIESTAAFERVQVTDDFGANNIPAGTISVWGRP